MALSVDIHRQDQKTLDVLARIADAVESIAETLKLNAGEQIDPADVAGVTQRVKDSTAALAGALPPTT